MAERLEANDRDCAEVLNVYFAGVPTRSFRAAAKADVGSLRIEGNYGFLLYHGAENVDYSMPMAREGGRWKVGAFAGSALL